MAKTLTCVMTAASDDVPLAEIRILVFADRYSIVVDQDKVASNIPAEKCKDFHHIDVQNQLGPVVNCLILMEGE